MDQSEEQIKLKSAEAAPFEQVVVTFFPHPHGSVPIPQRTRAAGADGPPASLPQSHAEHVVGATGTEDSHMEASYEAASTQPPPAIFPAPNDSQRQNTSSHPLKVPPPDDTQAHIPPVPLSPPASKAKLGTCAAAATAESMQPTQECHALPTAAQKCPKSSRQPTVFQLMLACAAYLARRCECLAKTVLPRSSIYLAFLWPLCSPHWIHRCAML